MSGKLMAISPADSQIGFHSRLTSSQLPALLASQPRSGSTIDICITPAGSPLCFSELEAAFRHTIEIWKDVWDSITLSPNQNHHIPSGQFHFSVVAMISAEGNNATYGTIRPLSGGKKGFVAELQTYGSETWSWKEAVVYPETESG